MKNVWQEERLAACFECLAAGPLVMGILNVTPDSFSDGGCFNQLDQARTHALAMVRQGAAIIDIGGESTRPGAVTVGEPDERARIEPAIEVLAQEIHAAISIDTYKAKVARRAVELGAVLINDIWGLQGDPMMAATVAETGAGVVVMHNRHEVDPALDVMADVIGFFERSLEIAEKAGIEPSKIILDPGIGFAKLPRQNHVILREFERLKSFGCPLLLGLSRKRFLGEILNRPADGRLFGSLSANMIGLMRGADILRVHDVEPHVHAIKVMQAIAHD